MWLCMIRICYWSEKTQTHIRKLFYIVFFLKFLISQEMKHWFYIISQRNKLSAAPQFPYTQGVFVLSNLINSFLAITLTAIENHGKLSLFIVLSAMSSCEEIRSGFQFNNTLCVDLLVREVCCLCRLHTAFEWLYFNYLRELIF